MTNRTPTPVPSEVAETTAGEREVEALAKLIETREELREVYRVWSERRQNLSDLTRRLDENARQIADALTPAVLDRVRREEGERIAQAIEAGVLPSHPSDHYKDGFRRAAQIARAASVGRGEGL